MILDTASAFQRLRHRSAAKRRVLASVSATALLTTLAINPVHAQTAPAGAVVDEIVVTGSRIVRDGFEAPTPVTVMSAQDIQDQSQPNIADFVNTMPTFEGSTSPSTSQSSVSAGSAGVNSLNMRGVGANRTLVLLDGQRSVASLLTGIVDVNTIPQALISRVDVVTGGASAAYGSDAVAGVVNFILDKEFTGLKGEVSGGITTYGDNENWKVSLTGGTPFAAGRGHVLLSGEMTHKAGIFDSSNRDWNNTGIGALLNPAYTATNGQPRELYLTEVGGAHWAQGGLISQGPLKGIAFGEGGVPYNYFYGDIVNGGNMRGGEWKASEVRQTKGSGIDSRQGFQSIFGRVSYDLSDNIELFAQGSYSNANVLTQCCPQFSPNAFNVSTDVAFIPQSVRQLANSMGVTVIRMGTLHPDLPPTQTDNTRSVERWVVGANGTFGAFGGDWNWDAYFQMGTSRNLEKVARTFLRDRMAWAIDAVAHPTNGTIVCRINVDANPGNDDPACTPYNIFGVNVNSQAALNYVAPGYPVGPWRRQTIEQNVGAFSVSGEPFSLPAGPVSLAFGAEHRTEEVSGTADAESARTNTHVGNYLPNFGKYSVTEGYLETVVPLASGASWAESWDINAAVRATDYSTSGYVTTWKIGTTFRPIPDITFRATRSRDIRSANLIELFEAGGANTNQVIDRFNNDTIISYLGYRTGNANLLPEKADTTGVGVVLQPAFVPGFSMSFDYYNIDLKDAIGSVGPQTIVDFCFQGNASYCDAIIRSVNESGVNVIERILISPFNTTQEITRGYDVEAIYRVPLESMVETWGGDLTLRGFVTRILKDYADNGVNTPTDVAGASNPKWKYNARLSYDLDAFRASLTARGRSSGNIDNTKIVCTSGCPTSTVENVTTNYNYRDGTFYMDASFSYQITEADIDGYGINAFLNVSNVLNAPPARNWPGPGGSPFYPILGDCGNGSDCQGRVFRAGVRFEM